MDAYPEDIVQQLEQQKRFHQEQLRLIELALAAVRSGKAAGAGTDTRSTANRIKKHRIQWTREISRRLDDFDEFTIMDLQRDLADKSGITSADTVQGQNIINNTLNRLEKRGLVQKVSPGVYQVVRDSLTT